MAHWEENFARVEVGGNAESVVQQGVRAGPQLSAVEWPWRARAIGAGKGGEALP